MPVTKKWFNRSYYPPTVDTYSGNDLEKEYQLVVCEKTGLHVLQETGVRNHYEFIQSFATEVSLDSLLKRYANGDETALHGTNDARFGDFTRIPTSLLEAKAMLDKGQLFFNSLSLEEREKYKFSFGKFLKDFDFVPKKEEIVPKKEEIVPKKENISQKGEKNDKKDGDK